MARIGVPHTCPVMVIVDTETGTVERVIVFADEIVFTPEGGWNNYDREDNEISTEEEAQATLIAQAADVDWPELQIGWEGDHP